MVSFNLGHPVKGIRIPRGGEGFREFPIINVMRSQKFTIHQLYRQADGRTDR